MAYLTIEFTGRITASDSEIRVAVSQAQAIFAAAGKSPEAAYCANVRAIQRTGYDSNLWTRANYEATKNMGAGASLAWR